MAPCFLQHKIQAPQNHAHGRLSLALPLPLMALLALLRKPPPVFLPFSDRRGSAALPCVPQAASNYRGKSLSFRDHIFCTLLLGHSRAPQKCLLNQTNEMNRGQMKLSCKTRFFSATRSFAFLKGAEACTSFILAAVPSWMRNPVP